MKKVRRGNRGKKIKFIVSLLGQIEGDDSDAVWENSFNDELLDLGRNR